MWIGLLGFFLEAFPLILDIVAPNSIFVESLSVSTCFFYCLCILTPLWEIASKFDCLCKWLFKLVFTSPVLKRLLWTFLWSPRFWRWTLHSNSCLLGLGALLYWGPYFWPILKSLTEAQIIRFCILLGMKEVVIKLG